jgi:GAF domain-containing protein
MTLSLDEIARRTLAGARASRVTIRVASLGFDVAAEALSPGTPSVAGTRPNPGADPVVERVFKGDTVVANEVEDDLAPGDPRAQYRIFAEIVTPVLHGKEVVGVLSVHDTVSAREWTSDEVDQVKQAAQDAAQLIDAHPAP